VIETHTASSNQLASRRSAPTYPSLYQINTRVTLTELSRKLQRNAMLDDIPDGDLDRLAEDGFDWVWFLGVWQTGPTGRKVSLENAEWKQEFQQLLPDFSDRDVSGSFFAVQSYTVHSDFGGNAALAHLRKRLRDRGIQLLLDFVPNHTAQDHSWVQQHPEYYVHGTEEQFQREPQNYIRVATSAGTLVLGYGRDPYFAGWPDTLQLNYANADFQEAMMCQLESVASMCDGVRCDMAMLVLPEVFEKTWGLRSSPFWPEAIKRVHRSSPDFLFMAEVYWDLEWALQQQGFDYTYDKRLYDRLEKGVAASVRDHFRADMDFQRKSVRFMENHDEPRSAAVFPTWTYRAAAVLTYFCPGLRFFHQGQMEGFTKKISVHLNRGPAEPINRVIEDFYEHLLACLCGPDVRDGDWSLIECAPAWDGNWTWDCFICFVWRLMDRTSLVIAVNYAGNQSQCYLPLPFDDLHGKTLQLKDLLSPAEYTRSGDDLRSKGLYLDLAAWGYNVFELRS
jgi:Alpha amylase, catalytic domain